MTELQTKKTKASVSAYLNAIKDDQVRKDCKTIAGIMQKATKSKPAMWGPAIIGFGEAKLKYASGREIDWMQIAFSARKQAITLYLASGFDGYDALMAKLGAHSCSKACIYIKRLSDVHVPTLTKLIQASVKVSSAR